MKISVVGAGYVGLSNAILLAKNNDVKLFDIDNEKINLLKNKKSPIKDTLIEKYLSKKTLSLSFDNKLGALNKTEAVLIATPTNFDTKKNSFDTSSIEGILSKLREKKYSKLVIIRSTVPIGFTDRMQKKFSDLDISFFPEFLREGQALKDSLYPSRIICGSNTKKGRDFLKVLEKSSIKPKAKSQITSPSEAEAIKLFSNTFLAMRISFFNELDSFATSKNLSSKNIIEGVSSDSRIGNYYNNPSFGYGGYCLPKDTQQLEQNFGKIPQKLISGAIQSNALRKRFILNEILNKKVNKIGIYRLSMKAGSDNWREAAVLDIIKGLKKEAKQVMIFEPMIKTKTFMGFRIENDLAKFKKESKLIISNRIDKDIEDKADILFTRDIFEDN